MMQMLRKKYTITLTVSEPLPAQQGQQGQQGYGQLMVGQLGQLPAGSAQSFWDKARGKTGADELVEAVRLALTKEGPDIFRDISVRLSRFEEA